MSRLNENTRDLHHTHPSSVEDNVEPCELCKGNGYAIMFNTQDDIKEVQKCDGCKMFDSDESAEKQMVQDIASNRK